MLLSQLLRAPVRSPFRVEKCHGCCRNTKLQATKHTSFRTNIELYMKPALIQMSLISNVSHSITQVPGNQRLLVTKTNRLGNPIEQTPKRTHVNHEEGFLSTFLSNEVLMAIHQMTQENKIILIHTCMLHTAHMFGKNIYII